MVASIRCSLFLAGFLFQKPLSPKHRSTFLPLQHAATFIFSVDWGLTLESFIRLDEREPPKSEKLDSVEGIEGPARDVLQIGSYIFAALGLLPSFIELCANKIAQNGSG